MTDARKLNKLRDAVAQALGWKRRPHTEVDAPYAITRVHAPVDQAAHNAMLRRIRLEGKD